MSAPRHRLVRDAASRGTYAPLYRHLPARAGAGSRWRASFAKIGRILDFILPASARLHRPWWLEPTREEGHGHAPARQASGWKTREVSLDAQAPTFERARGEPAPHDTPDVRRPLDPDEFWPRDTRRFLA